MTHPTYALSGVGKVYGTGEAQVHALRDVHLTIDPGELVVVAGPSGSGKTTLLQLLGALDRPSRGEVRFEGEDLGRLPDGRMAEIRRAALGFVFQGFNLIPTLTAQQNVEVPMAATPLPSRERRLRARALLAGVGLGARAGHLPSQLSGGEQQRVAIARALANRPRVLLADEPTGNLDSGTGEEIMGLLHRLRAEEDLTLVLVTHDPRFAEAAPRVLLMRDGRLAAPRELASAGDRLSER